jgi:hypothetical protein
VSDPVDPNVSYSVEEIVDVDVSKFRLETEDQNPLILGSCPRCGHDVDMAVGAEVMMFVRSPKPGSKAPPVPHELVMSCNCLQAHVGGSLGCGRYWGFTVKAG